MLCHESTTYKRITNHTNILTPYRLICFHLQNNQFSQIHPKQIDKLNPNVHRNHFIYPNVEFPINRSGTDPPKDRNRRHTRYTRKPQQSRYTRSGHTSNSISSSSRQHPRGATPSRRGTLWGVTKEVFYVSPRVNPKTSDSRFLFGNKGTRLKPRSIGA